MVVGVVGLERRAAPESQPQTWGARPTTWPGRPRRGGEGGVAVGCLAGGGIREKQREERRLQSAPPPRCFLYDAAKLLSVGFDSVRSACQLRLTVLHAGPAKLPASAVFRVAISNLAFQNKRNNYQKNKQFISPSLHSYCTPPPPLLLLPLCRPTANSCLINK